MKRRGKVRRGLARHWVSIAIVSVAIIATLVGLTWFANTEAQKTAQNATITQQNKNDAVSIAAETAQRKAAEEKARQEAQEAAAREAAEQSRQGNNAATINPASCNVSKTHNNPASIDVVVNKKHCIQPLGYTPSNLVTSHGATLSALAVDSFNQMYDAAAAAGQGFSVTSSYRSYSTQISTYNRWVSISGQAGADTYSARPGYSEHQTGFALDVAAGSCTLDCFGSTSQYQWFQANAANYGFIQRYYKGYESTTGYSAEEWHYRYVGAEVAKDMKAKDIKTLEEYWGVSGGDY